MKKLFLFQLIIIILFSCSNPTENNDKELQKDSTDVGNLEIGKIIGLQKAKLIVTGVSISNETPVNKLKPKVETNQFILVNLKIKEINKDVQLSTVSFVLKDSENNKYDSPGSWGKIDIGGGPSDFEASEGATSYLSKVNDEINLIFEVPVNIKLKNTLLQYSWK